MKLVSLRPNAKRAKNAILLIYIVMALDVISIVSGYMQYSLLVRMVQGDYSMLEAEMNDLRQMFIGYIYIITLVVSAVFFIMWFRRAFFNVHQLSRRLRYSEGWAAGAWFVPIMNLFRPFQIMSEMVNETRSILVNRSLISKDQLNSSLVGLWWAAWIVNNLFGNFVYRYANNAETVDNLMNATLFDIISSGLGLFAGFAAITVIKMYAAVEVVLAEVPEYDRKREEENKEGYVFNEADFPVE